MAYEVSLVTLYNKTTTTKHWCWCLSVLFLIYFHHIFSLATKLGGWTCSLLRVKTLERTHQTHKHRTRTLIRKSLNMHLLLITLEINSSGRAVTGARCYWQTAVAVTDNMRYLSILHCNPHIRLSLSPSLPLLLPSTIPCSLVLQAQLPFPFSRVVRWEMIPEPKHLSQQQSTETKLHREELQGRSGKQERMRGQSVYEIKALLRKQKCGTNWKMGRERCVGGEAGHWIEWCMVWILPLWQCPWVSQWGIEWCIVDWQLSPRIPFQRY